MLCKDGKEIFLRTVAGESSGQLVELDVQNLISSKEDI